MSFGNGSIRTNPIRGVDAKDNNGARVKQVYDTDKIPHLWAHQTQTSARNAGGNLYFNGRTIYSYGSHFPIASHVVNRKGVKAVIFTSGKWGSTTNAHVWQVRRAIPSGLPVFEFDYVRNSEPEDDGTLSDYSTRMAIAAYVTSIQTCVDNAQLARQTKTIERHLHDARSYAAQLAEFVKFFGLPAMSVKARIAERKLPYIPTDAADAKRTGKAKRDARDREESERKARMAADYAINIARWMQANPDYAAKWDGTIEHAEKLQRDETQDRYSRQAEADKARRWQILNDFMDLHPDIKAGWDGDYARGYAMKHSFDQSERERKENEALAGWLAGDASIKSHNLPSSARYGDTLLRVVGDTVETSRGADFPLHHARRGYALVKGVIASGVEWRRNGKTCHLGHYEIDRITADGTVHAGCHVVPFSSIEAIAGKLTEGTVS